MWQRSENSATVTLHGNKVQLSCLAGKNLLIQHKTAERSNYLPAVKHSRAKKDFSPDSSYYLSFICQVVRKKRLQMNNSVTVRCVNKQLVCNKS